MIYFCVSTVSEDAAPGLARQLVEERLAACVNIVPKVRSIYRDDGKIHDVSESILFFKSAPRTAGGFEDRFRELHPYDCPELLMFSVDEGLKEYFQWVASVTGPDAHAATPGGSEGTA